MPATYAHHRFGEQCLGAMPLDLKELCTRNREIFDFGVHGPDLLFYYHPLSSNQVNQYGQNMHHRTGEEVFRNMASVYRSVHADPSVSVQEKEVLKTYMIGFLAHFTLDSCCHGYINARTADSEFSHNFIESQYEAYLMKKDGRKSHLVDRSQPLCPSMKGAEVIAKLFPFDADQILGSMKGQKFIIRLFYSPLGIKRTLVRALIRILRIGGNFGDLFLNRTESEACSHYNKRILQLQEEAIERFPEMINNLLAYLNSEEVLCSFFKYDFEGELHND